MFSHMNKRIESAAGDLSLKAGLLDANGAFLAPHTQELNSSNQKQASDSDAGRITPEETYINEDSKKHVCHCNGQCRHCTCGEE